jgi:triacylglycerol lipase
LIVVLVHGFFNRGTIFRPLERALTRRGHVCLCPTLTPRDARYGIADLAAKLDGFIAAHVPPGESFALVGFSMGCLVARVYLQNLRGHSRVESPRPQAFFAIAGPHRGSLTAYLYPGRGTREMRPGSRFLRELELGDSEVSGLQRFSYWTPFDLMVVPASSARWPGATEVKVRAPWHTRLLSCRAVAEDIDRRLAELARDSPVV